MLGPADLECSAERPNKIGAIEADCTWDQRIPNSPILNRLYLIQHAPMFNHNIPQSSNGQCIKVHRNPYLDSTDRKRRTAMKHWLKQMTASGLVVRNPNKKTRTSKKTARICATQYPNKPWVHGINKPIDKESILLHRSTLISGVNNNKDCIDMDHYKYDATIDRYMIRRYFPSVPQHSGPVFNQMTRAKWRKCT